MTPVELLATASLLGLYVLLAGGYALFYTVARLKNHSVFGRGALAFYALHCAVGLAVVLWTPLGPAWKALLIASTVTIAAIPPIMWRYLNHTHGTGRASV